jgi:hypothetical protein
MWCDDYGTIPLQSSSPKLITPVHSGRKHQKNSSWEAFYKIPNQYSLPQNCQDHIKQRKAKEQYCQEEPKETWPQNVVWDLGWDPRTESQVKTKEMWVKYECYLKIRHQNGSQLSQVWQLK